MRTEACKFETWCTCLKFINLVFGELLFCFQVKNVRFFFSCKKQYLHIYLSVSKMSTMKFEASGGFSFERDNPPLMSSNHHDVHDIISVIPDADALYGAHVCMWEYLWLQQPSFSPAEKQQAIVDVSLLVALQMFSCFVDFTHKQKWEAEVREVEVRNGSEKSSSEKIGSEKRGNDKSRSAN